MKKTTKLKTTKRTRSPWSIVLIFVILFAVVGAVLLLTIQAATPSISLESEDGTVTASAEKISDASASGGEAVQFKKTADTTNACSVPNLKFCDDFNGAAGSAIDSSKWKIMNGASSWGVECWTNSPNNIAIDGAGNLKMTVRKESSCSGSRSYSSGGVETGGKFYFQYGKVEIRAKAACGGGVWPALWTSTGNNGPSWPQSGEIDILEIMDGDPYNAQQTLHGPRASDPTKDWAQINKSNKSSTQWCTAYHTYGIDWRQGYIDFMIDGAVKHHITSSQTPSDGKWPFDSYNQRILLDLQIGSWGGTINDNDLPSSMLIDYIRIYN